VDDFMDEYSKLLRSKAIKDEQDAINYAAEHFTEVANELSGTLPDYQSRRSPVSAANKVSIGEGVDELSIHATIPPKTLDDVVGLTEIKSRIRRQLIKVIKKEGFERIIESETHVYTNNFLFQGGPGTGKTHMAECIAGELKIPYYPVTGSTFEQKWHGLASSYLREIYDQAARHEHSLVLIDEADTLLTDRNAYESKHNKGVINELLALIDGISKQGNIATIVLTNMELYHIDAAVKDRFSVFNTIRFPELDDKTRVAIAKYIYGQYRHDEYSDDDFNRIASDLQAVNPRHIRHIMHQAAIYTHDKSKYHISLKEVSKAIAEYNELQGEISG